MKTQNEDQNDVARRILAELAEMAEHASMTRSLRGGEKSAAQAYNRVLTTLTASGEVPEGMFESIEAEGAEFGQIGVQCRLLLSAVSGKRKDRDEGGLGAVVALAPFLKSEDLAHLVRERMGSGARVPDGLLAGLAPFLGSDLLGEIVRQGMRGPVAPSTTEPLAPSEPVYPAEPAHVDLRPVVPVTPPASLESLVDELRRTDLSHEDRQRIATRLAELSYEQSVHGLE